MVLTSSSCSLSLMKACQAFCRSSCSVDRDCSGKSVLAREVKIGILGSLDSGSTLECDLLGLWMMTISGKAAKTSPHVASLLFAFSYVFAHIKAEWSVTSSILSPSMKGWKHTKLSLAASASLSVAEYLVSADASTLLQYATTLSTGIKVSSQSLLHLGIGRRSSCSLDNFVTSSGTPSPFLYNSCSLL